MVKFFVTVAAMAMSLVPASAQTFNGNLGAGKPPAKGGVSPTVVVGNGPKIVPGQVKINPSIISHDGGGAMSKIKTGK